MHHRATAADASLWTADTAARRGPLHGRADKNRRIVDVAAAIRALATAVDLVAVVLVVGDPVNVIESAIVVLQGVVVVVPEAIEPLFFRRQALVLLVEDVPPRLLTAVVQFAPGVCAVLANSQCEDGAQDQSKAFQRDSFSSLAPMNGIVTNPASEGRRCSLRAPASPQVTLPRV